MSGMVKVLVVDDESVTRMMVRRVLSNAGYEVVEAEDGDLALALCVDSPPDAVLMDVRMPVMNGFDACRAIRQQPRCAHVPVLMLTALDDVVAVTLAFEAGATDFITKPINWVLLSQRLRYVLRVNRNERKLLESQQTLARAHRIARLASWSMDLNSSAFRCSPEMRSMLGLFMPNEPTLADVLAMLAEDDRAALGAFLDRINETQSEQQVEVRMRGAKGELRHMVWSGNVILDERGGAGTVFGVVQDITEWRAAEARLSYQAHFDTRTGLPNRVLFRDRLNTAISAVQHGGPRFAVLEIKTDALGKTSAAASPAIGDRVLKALAERIASVMREGDTLCRLEDERFAMLLTDVNTEITVAAVVTRLIEAFTGPLAVDQWEVISAVDIGVAMYPADGEDVDTLLTHASAALARAAVQLGSSYQFYADGIQQRVASQIATQVALYRGLEREEFELHFQPVLDLRSNRISSIEALLRWRRPGVGLQMPSDFINILEETGLIADATEWVLRSGSRSALPLPLRLAINVSPRQFRAVNLPDRLARVIEEVGFPPERLEVEITERALLADEEHAMNVLRELSERGIHITLDDYGIGFSSLQRLKQLPLDSLKIDRFFVTSLLADTVDAAIVRSTVELCHELGVKVVAEGAEDEVTIQRLRELDCDLVQGYAIGRPMPLEDLTRWLGQSQFAPL